MLRILLLSTVIATGTLAIGGCGDDDVEDIDPNEPEPEPEPDPVPGETVAGVVSYEGDAAGNLVFGLYPMLPPTGPPVAFTSVGAPEYPVEFELTGVAPGTYQLLTVLDINGDNPTMPGPEDIQVGSAPFEITAEVGAWVEVEIVDP